MLPVVALISLACGASQARGTSDVQEIDELRLVASEGAAGNVEIEVYDAEGLFKAGLRAADTADCATAETHYLRLLKDFPSSRYASAAMYNAALCWHENDACERAIPHYEKVSSLSASSEEDTRHASLQRLACQIDTDAFADADTNATALLARKDLSHEERVEALAQRARAKLGADDIDAASAEARRAIQFARAYSDDVVKRLHVASAHFVYAETLRRKQASIPIPKDTAEKQKHVFDARAQAILDAQRAYIEAIEVGSKRWSLASAYAIGAMFEDFHQDILDAPVPPPKRRICRPREVDSERCIDSKLLPEYEAGYRKEVAAIVRPLLRRSITAWEITIMSAERMGESQSKWAEKAREDLARAREYLMALDGISSADDATAP